MYYCRCVQCILDFSPEPADPNKRLPKLQVTFPIQGCTQHHQQSVKSWCTVSTPNKSHPNATSRFKSRLDATCKSQIIASCQELPRASADHLSAEDSWTPVHLVGFGELSNQGSWTPGFGRPPWTPGADYLAPLTFGLQDGAQPTLGLLSAPDQCATDWHQLLPGGYT